jgi:hypothetical protein
MNVERLQAVGTDWQSHEDEIYLKNQRGQLSTSRAFAARVHE